MPPIMYMSFIKSTEVPDVTNLIKQLNEIRKKMEEVQNTHDKVSIENAYFLH